MCLLRSCRERGLLFWKWVVVGIYTRVGVGGSTVGPAVTRGESCCGRGGLDRPERGDVFRQRRRRWRTECCASRVAAVATECQNRAATGTSK